MLNLKPKVLFEIKNQTIVVCTLYDYFYFYFYFILNLWCSLDGDHPSTSQFSKSFSINKKLINLNPDIFLATYLNHI
jgi:hypothetical protein